MRRRHLLALPPLGALAACTADPSTPAAPEDPEATGSREGGGADPERSGEPEPPSRAESLLEQLGEREIAGQLVLVGLVAGHDPDLSLLTDQHAGGVFLLQVWESPEDVDAVVTAVTQAARADLPPLIAVDQEGGQVRMLRGDAARPVPSAQELGEQGPDAVAQGYATIGEDLAARGIHLALSPVADVVDPALGSANEPIGGLQRGFGTDPEEVADCVSAATEALAGAGVAATLKHFPGLGRVEQNTDFSAEGIRDDVTGAGDPFLLPFAAGIGAGAEVVMLSSAIYPQLEADVPAMFSSAVVEDLLRDRMGFTGLVVTDDIGAAAAVAEVPVAERVTRLLAAGGDAVLTADPSLTGELVEAVVAWARESPEQDARVRESAGRMLALKEQLGLLEP